MKKLFLLLLPIIFFSCVKKELTYQILDFEHKSFYVNGVSASEGLETVIQSIEDIGFRGYKIDTVDLRCIGKGISYYAVWENHNDLTKSQFDKLTGNLFTNLPSSDLILEEVNNNGCSIFLEWYPSNILKKVVIQLSNNEYEADANEVNKRLSTIFPHSRIGNSYGYKEYFTDDNLVCWYTNNFCLSLEQR